MADKSVLFYVGHPAHYHNIRHAARSLKEKGFSVLVVARQKDVLFRLLEDCPVETALLPAPSGNSRWKKALHLLQREWRMTGLIRRHRPALLIGTDMIITHAGRLLGIPSFILNEDDAEAVPLFARLAYPFASGILCPEVCSVGRYEKKKIGYAGYHELAYLHPSVFTPDPSRVRELGGDRPYYLLRFVELTAHHDTGKRGISAELAREIIRRLERKGRVYITSERELESEFEPYRIRIHPRDMHHAMYYADLLIGDSQTMTAEAAVLGTPALRFNDFVGKLAYLEELEHRWKLTYGFRTDQENLLLMKLDELLGMPDRKVTWQQRRKEMLRSSVSLSELLVWFVETFPVSWETAVRDSGFYRRFIHSSL
jgi:predicted glycosyltransferase